jgi:osmotically inducible lipoprotein OsmB
MMQFAPLRQIIIASAIASLSMLCGCTLGGAAVGGVAGHELTHSKAGTIGGAVVGGVVGYELGK